MKKINIILFFIMLISLIILSFSVLRLNILPDKYLIIYFILISILNIILGLITFVNKNKIIRYIFTFIIILISILSFFVSFVVLGKTSDFIENIKEIEEQSIYYLICLKESNYKDINNLNGKTIGISNNGTDYNTIKLLKNKIEFKEVRYDNLFNLYDDLLNNKIACIYIDSNIKMLFDEVVNDFSDKTMIINEFNIKSSIEEKNKEEDNSFKDSINIYISGIDTYGSIDKVSRSDVNIIMSINQKKKKILLTTIPRDTYVQLHGTNGPKDKLTHAGIYGINMSVTTLEDFLGIDIDYYVRVNFDTLISTIDAIGGVDVYSDITFKAGGYNFYEGNNNMNGKQALVFSRERKQFTEGDNLRGKHQQAVIAAIVEKVTSSKTLLSNYTNILASLNNSFQSNIDDDIIKKFVKEQLNSMSSWDVKSISIEGTGTYTQSTYSMPGWNLYVMVPNEETVIYAHNEINSLSN